MVQIPIWHWGEGIYKTRAAKSEVRIAQYQLQDAREKIELQVNQAAFKVNEAGKKAGDVYQEYGKGGRKSPLRQHSASKRESLPPAMFLKQAQKAWLSAQSEKIGTLK